MTTKTTMDQYMVPGNLSELIGKGEKAVKFSDPSIQTRYNGREIFYAGGTKSLALTEDGWKRSVKEGHRWESEEGLDAESISILNEYHNLLSEKN